MHESWTSRAGPGVRSEHKLATDISYIEASNWNAKEHAACVLVSVMHSSPAGRVVYKRGCIT